MGVNLTDVVKHYEKRTATENMFYRVEDLVSQNNLDGHDDRKDHGLTQFYAGVLEAMQERERNPLAEVKAEVVAPDAVQALNGLKRTSPQKASAVASQAEAKPDWANPELKARNRTPKGAVTEERKPAWAKGLKSRGQSPRAPAAAGSPKAPWMNQALRKSTKTQSESPRQSSTASTTPFKKLRSAKRTVSKTAPVEELLVVLPETHAALEILRTAELKQLLDHPKLKTLPSYVKTLKKKMLRNKIAQALGLTPNTGRRLIERLIRESERCIRS